MTIFDTEQYKEINKCTNELLSHIDNLLLREEYSEVSNILFDKQVVTLSAYNRTLYVLRIMNSIYQKELQQQIQTHVFLKRNTHQLEELYINLGFYLRRLEFSFPLDLQKNLLSYMSDEGLSFISILGVIQNNTYIYNKDDTLNAFHNLVQSI